MRPSKFILLLLLLSFSFSHQAKAAHSLSAPTAEAAPSHGAESADEPLDMQQYIFGHIGDSYEWHIATIGSHHITIPLPCIVIDGGLHIFSSERMAEHGYSLDPQGKLINSTTQKRPIDLSITKNVVGLFFAAALLVFLILSCARWYRKHDVLKEKPTGLAALLEPVIMMIETEVIRDIVGPSYKRFSPYLLTAFFFILTNNLLGIIPIFPAGANVTGNIAVTLVLAVFTFLMVNLFGTKHYYKDIIWPEVPIFLKAIPIMPIIEIVGTLTKPFSLMIRLFANMLAGHIMILCIVGIIFITARMGALLNGSMTLVAVLFGVFLDCLEVLVSFLQAYVFTMLSAVFIGMAQQQGHKPAAKTTNKQ